MIDFARREERRTDFDSIAVRMASPEEIRGWSRGEVTKPETINYRSYKPEPMGLFCQRIFGPEKDWRCGCGKYDRIRFRGMICDKCGVEVTVARVRRERMGHIELAVPICHMWFYKTLPSQIGYLLFEDATEAEKKSRANGVVVSLGSQTLDDFGGEYEEISLTAMFDGYKAMLIELIGAKEFGDKFTELRSNVAKIWTRVESGLAEVGKAVDEVAKLEDPMQSIAEAGDSVADAVNAIVDRRRDFQSIVQDVDGEIEKSGKSLAAQLSELSNVGSKLVVDFRDHDDGVLTASGALVSLKDQPSAIGDMLESLKEKELDEYDLEGHDDKSRAIDGAIAALEEKLLDMARFAEKMESEFGALDARATKEIPALEATLAEKVARLGDAVNDAAANPGSAEAELPEKTAGLEDAASDDSASSAGLEAESPEPSAGDAAESEAAEAREDAETGVGGPSSGLGEFIEEQASALEKAIEDAHAQRTELAETKRRLLATVVACEKARARVADLRKMYLLKDVSALKRLQSMARSAKDKEFFSVDVPLIAPRRLDTLRSLERVIYYADFVVTNPAGQEREFGPFGRKVEYLELLKEDDEYELRVKAAHGGEGRFKAEIGAEGVRTLLRQLDSSETPVDERNKDGRGLDRLAAWLREEVGSETSQQRKRKKLKRLKMVEGLRSSGSTPDKRNKPEWMVLEVIPVLPPDIRPLVPLDGGRFATSDMNDLYRRVINRNNRLKKLIDLGSPEVILRNEKRMLQESVDALFDNGRRSKPIRGRGKRPLKSLTDNLKGKQGRFRQNLLGKRVDYSGRSVIVVGPELRLDQCGLPKAMAVELFKPFIIHELEKRGEAETVKQAKTLVEAGHPAVYEVLEDIIRDHPVLLNRAPTLHRLGIQAFEPVLVEGKAIRIHPLVCAAFNADFDGDAMAVHVPLSFEAQMEARVLMLSSNNLLLPSNGRPVTAPTQDIVIGCYYLTKPSREIALLEQRIRNPNTPEAVRAKAEEEFAERYENARRFSSYGELEMELEHGLLNFRDPCWFWSRDKDADESGAASGSPWVPTTVGRVLFNSIIPDPVPFLNQVFDKTKLAELVFQCFKKAGWADTTRFLDHLKDFGFRYATLGGISVGVDDLEVPREKAEILMKADGETDRFRTAYDEGVISEGERYNKIVDAWTHANNDVADAMVRQLERSKGGFNPVFMMMDSGARGNRDQMRQLAGMRGLMARPQQKFTGARDIIESPIQSNFREGLTVGEYFISTHGGRKGLADTALKTAEAGYLTRRLVDVAQDVTITEADCGTVLGLEVEALREGDDVIEPLKERIEGNVAVQDVCHPATGEILVEANMMITEEDAQRIEEDAGIDKVKIRSVLTCESPNGLCRQCYGSNLATMDIVDIGEAVGILAAQSIGEPGTQLTLRTFHFGGSVARTVTQDQRKSRLKGLVEFKDISTVEDRNGQQVVTSQEGQIVLKSSHGQVLSQVAVPYGAIVSAQKGTTVEVGELLFSRDPYLEPIVNDVFGFAHFVDIRKETMREEFDATTGHRQRTIVEDRAKSLHPVVQVREGVSSTSKLLKEFIMPVGAQLRCADGDEVRPGDPIAKSPRAVFEMHDITGGLPRIEELFEARRPKDPAVITKINGVVAFGEVKRGKREVFVTPRKGDRERYEVPVGKHLRVHEGDHVRAGHRLSEGSVDPHDILRIKGPREVQEHLLNEIQGVYRLQGVKINDKHIGVIVRQMLRKVKVVKSGETDLLEGDPVDWGEFRRINDEAVADGREPARSEPLLLGVTKASLETRSFISAASFQETTRVLTDAAVRGAKDALKGLKENIVIGHLIPAGTGIHRWNDVEFEMEREFYEDEILPLTAFEQEPSQSVFSTQDSLPESETDIIERLSQQPGVKPGDEQDSEAGEPDGLESEPAAAAQAAASPE